MSLADDIQSFFQRVRTERNPWYRVLLALLIVLGSVLVMSLGLFLIGIILIVSPFLTPIVLLFLLLYGITAGLSRKQKNSP